MSNRIVEAAKGVLLKFLPDVYITTDHSKGANSGKSPGKPPSRHQNNKSHLHKISPQDLAFPCGLKPQTEYFTPLMLFPTLLDLRSLRLYLKQLESKAPSVF
jgi:hypothetical protein